MNPDNCGLATRYVSQSYVAQGQQALARRQRLVKALLSSGKMPEEGWDEMTIEALIQVGEQACTARRPRSGHHCVP